MKYDEAIEHLEELISQLRVHNYHNIGSNDALLIEGVKMAILRLQDRGEKEEADGRLVHGEDR